MTDASRERFETWREVLGALRDAMNTVANEQNKLERRELLQLLNAFRHVVEAEHALHKALEVCDE